MTQTCACTLDYVHKFIHKHKHKHTHTHSSHQTNTRAQYTVIHSTLCNHMTTMALEANHTSHQSQVHSTHMQKNTLYYAQCHGNPDHHPYCVMLHNHTLPKFSSRNLQISVKRLLYTISTEPEIMVRHLPFSNHFWLMSEHF